MSVSNRSTMFKRVVERGVKHELAQRKLAAANELLVLELDTKLFESDLARADKVIEERSLQNYTEAFVEASNWRVANMLLHQLKCDGFKTRYAYNNKRDFLQISWKDAVNDSIKTRE